MNFYKVCDKMGTELLISGHDWFTVKKRTEERMMSKTDAMIEKVKALVNAPSCCAEAKEAEITGWRQSIPRSGTRLQRN